MCRDFLGNILNSGDLIIYPLVNSGNYKLLQVGVFIDSCNIERKNYVDIQKTIIPLERIKTGKNKDKVKTTKKYIIVDILKINYKDLTKEQKDIYNELKYSLVI